MNATKAARKLIAADPSRESAKTLAHWSCRWNRKQFPVSSLYELNIESFELSIAILKERRLGRYYVGKAKLFDLSRQVIHLPT